jgi:hypothetical protein
LMFLQKLFSSVNMMSTYRRREATLPGWEEIGPFRKKYRCR